jgi:translation initiation factor IF-3
VRQEYRRNRQIRVPEVRLIDAEGKQVGVVQTKDAQRMAEEAGLDLVEVSPTARPPVCKILDFGKFRYEQNKRDRTGAGRQSQLKELRVRPTIDPHDLSYRVAQGRQFLEKGNKVQVVCIFRGRQMRHPEHGYKVMSQVAQDLADVSRVEMPAKMMGRRMSMTLSPVSQKVQPQKPREEKPAAAAAPAAPAPAAEAPRPGVAGQPAREPVT